MKRQLIFILSVMTLIACNQHNDGFKLKLNPKKFEKQVNGKQVNLYFLKNNNGLEMAVTNYGARVVALLAPDKDGNFEDIVQGFDNLDDYLNSKERFLGAVVGRFANRINRGFFTLDGVEYKLAVNNFPNHLHGGMTGFNSVVWDARQLNAQTLELNYLSPDMEEGYPGNLQVKMIYQLTDSNEFKITYEAVTDKKTVINLSHHSYFNLGGTDHPNINGHLVMINADYYTPVDSTLIPTGEIARVDSTPFDFRSSASIESKVNTPHEQLKYGLGYDHNWVLNKPSENELTFAARIIEPISKRSLEVFTTEPGLQIYGGNFIDGSLKGKYRQTYNYRSAFCIEPQHFPDSPNQPMFPSVILSPGEIYSQICIYKIGVAK